MKTYALVASVLLAFATVNWVTAQGWPGDPKNGRAIYEKHCVRCHGAAGKGDGVDGTSLVVSPANFSVSAIKGEAGLRITHQYFAWHRLQSDARMAWSLKRGRDVGCDQLYPNDSPV